MKRSPHSGRRQLWRSLWRLGGWSAAHRGINLLADGLALLALLAMSLGLAAGLVASSTYADRAEVSAARAPILADDGVPPALRMQTLGSAIDDRNVHVTVVEPLVSDAPLPPGADRWPGAAEAILSPELARLLGERGVADRFGRVRGLIGREGLASQTELLAYVGLGEPLDPELATPVAGFGVVGDDWPTGEVVYDRAVTEFWVLSLLLLVLPGMLALVAAARVADSETRRRHVLLARMGAPRWTRAVTGLPRLLLPAILSLAVSVGLMLLAATIDVRLPFKGNIIDATVVRGRLPMLVAGVIVVHVVGIVVLAFLIAARQGGLQASRLIAPPDRPAWRRTTALLVVLGTQPWAVALVGNTTARSLMTFAALAVAVVCLPAALATALRGLSIWRARRALAAGRVGTFLGWRITTYRSRAVARLTGTVGAVIVVVGHAAFVLTMFTDPATEARAVTDHIGTSLQVVRHAETDAGRVVDYLHDRDLAAVTVTHRHDYDTNDMLVAEQLTLAGQCSDLAVLGVACQRGPLTRNAESPQLDAIEGWYAGTSGHSAGFVVEVGSDPAHAGQQPTGYWHTTDQDLLVVSDDAAALDSLTLARDAHHQGLVVEIEPLGQLWIMGAADLLHKSYWLFVFGIPGILTLLLYSAFTWAAVVVEESNTLIRNPLFAERVDVFDRVATVRVAVPITVGGVAGVVVTVWLLAPHVQTGAAPLPTGFLLASTIAAPIVAALAWWATRTLTASMSREGR